MVHTICYTFFGIRSENVISKIFLLFNLIYNKNVCRQMIFFCHLIVFISEIFVEIFHFFRYKGWFNWRFFSIGFFVIFMHYYGLQRIAHMLPEQIARNSVRLSCNFYSVYCIYHGKTHTATTTSNGSAV